MSAFSTAVTSTRTTEQLIAGKEQKARLALWLDRAGAQPRNDVAVDLAACRGAPSAVSGCVLVSRAAGPVPTLRGSAGLDALVAYAAALSAVSSDQTCASVKGDAKALAVAVSDLATQAGATATGNVGLAATLASTAVCWRLSAYQLDVLRRTTRSADPLIAELIPLLASRDQQMVETLKDLAVRDLERADVSYQQGSGSLADVVRLTAAAQETQTQSPHDTIVQLGALHHRLTVDLQQPKVTLARVARDSAKLNDDLSDIRDALKASY